MVVNAELIATVPAVRRGILHSRRIEPHPPMSLHQQARNLIDQAGVAIQAGNPQYATELLRQSILYNGKDGDAYVLLGIALAQTGMPADADNAFVKATRLAPSNVKAHYNLAVHRYAQGEVRGALESARRAAEVDAGHAGARDLASRIEAELGLGHGEQPRTTAAGNPIRYREGYEETSVQTLPFIERLGAGWTAIGWLIALLSAACAVLFFSIVAPYMSTHQGNVDQAIQALGSNPMVGLIRVLYFLANIGGLAFIGLDAINRRGNLLWILPQAICGCTGFTFVVIPLYMRFGRGE